MSVSKEERERITRLVGTVDGQAARLLEFPEDHDTESRELASDAEALVSDARTLLSALGGVDERIAELQQENERLNYMLRYIDATAVDRRLTTKANEAWLKKRDREDS